MKARGKLLLPFLLGAALTASAQNPIIRNQFTADPTARVFNNKVYLYPSHDILPPEGQRQDWFCMADYHVFSSSNLIDWQDHGVIIDQKNVPWGNPGAYSMWAPDCVCKNGKYYFYFPNAPKEGRGFAIGVAVADRPEGPFKLEQEPIKGVVGIDPCVLIDNDGTAYIYWSGMGIRGAKLKANMKELDSLPPAPSPKGGTVRPGENAVPPFMGRIGGKPMEGLPEGFKEGPFAFRRGDWYYLTFPWVRGETGEGKNPTETLAYAMSKSPLGPWDFKGIIMAEHQNRCWTNHHSLLEYQGQWYLFYHHNDYSPNDDKRRSARIEKVSFNADGTIKEVKPTLRGVGVTPATSRIEIDRYSAASKATVEAIDTLNRFRGWYASLPEKGSSWVQYNDVDFSGLTDGYLVVCAKAADNTEFFVREKSPKGKVLARIKMTVKSEMTRPGMPAPFRRDQSNQWLTLTAPLAYTPKGVTDLVITSEGAPEVCVDWLLFKNRPKYFTSVPAQAAPAQPDGQGFIRRWKLMEPIAVDVRSNVIFTNTWLRDMFAEELARLPKQKGKWYMLDSENYNMKLFRFAEKYGKQTYGSFFWCETVIDCPEEINNVRFAAGSNGASIWWIDNEEVLLLEGDRRMVVDDGMSRRLTLKKGRNVLRGAVVNGPGLSDMCVRFLDEKGTPVTNYSVVF
jgi:hypothetical protein